VKREWLGGFNVPSIVPPLPIILYIELVRDILVDSDHDVGLVRSKAEDRERTRKGTDRCLKGCGSRPSDVTSEPVRLGIPRDLVMSVT